MAIYVLHRRHRLLYLVLAVLAFSSWGLWLAHSGRATAYGDTTPAGRVVATVTAAAAAPPTVRAAADGSGAALVTPSSMSASVAPSARSASALAGITDPLVFARRVSALLLTYTAATDFAARDTAVMAVAALPPLGDPAELRADLARYIPDRSAVGDGVSVRFVADTVSVSAWAATRISRLHLPNGSFGVDVTGRQIVTRPGGPSVTVSVTMGITGACPPALTQCEIDRVFPQSVRQELGR